MIIRVMAIDPNPRKDSKHDVLVYQVPEKSREYELLIQMFSECGIEYQLIEPTRPIRTVKRK